jgi:hypothetical protein
MNSPRMPSSTRFGLDGSLGSFAGRMTWGGTIFDGSRFSSCVFRFEICCWRICCCDSRSWSRAVSAACPAVSVAPESVVIRSSICFCTEDSCAFSPVFLSFSCDSSGPERLLNVSWACETLYWT